MKTFLSVSVGYNAIDLIKDKGINKTAKYLTKCGYSYKEVNEILVILLRNMARVGFK